MIIGHSSTQPQTPISEHRVVEKTSTVNRSHHTGAVRIQYRMTEDEKKKMAGLEARVHNLEKSEKDAEKKLEAAEKKAKELKSDLEALQAKMGPEPITALTLEYEQLRATTAAELEENENERAAEKEAWGAEKKELEGTVAGLTAMLTDMTRELTGVEAERDVAGRQETEVEVEVELQHEESDIGPVLVHQVESEIVFTAETTKEPVAELENLPEKVESVEGSDNEQF